MTNVTIVDVNVDFVNTWVDFKSVCCSEFDCMFLVTKNNDAIETEELVMLHLA